MKLSLTDLIIIEGRYSETWLCRVPSGTTLAGPSGRAFCAAIALLSPTSP